MWDLCVCTSWSKTSENAVIEAALRVLQSAALRYAVSLFSQNLVKLVFWPAAAASSRHGIYLPRSRLLRFCCQNGPAAVWVHSTTYQHLVAGWRRSSVLWSLPVNGEFVFFIQFYLIWITIVGGENAGARSTGKIFSRLACCGNRRRRGDEQQQNTESLESASSQVGVVFCVGRFGKKCWSWKKVFWGFWLKKWEVPNVFAVWTDAPEPTVRSDYASD